jgi:hypothetical protein
VLPIGLLTAQRKSYPVKKMAVKVLRKLDGFGSDNWYDTVNNVKKLKIAEQVKPLHEWMQLLLEDKGWKIVAATTEYIVLKK